MRLQLRLLFCLFLLGSCTAPPPTVSEKTEPPAIDGDAMKVHIQRLSSDEMEGRAPGGKGEVLATAYIADFYKSIGLKTQLQPVPLIGITATAVTMRLAGKGGRPRTEARR
jgi:hypothetical protein